VPLKDIYLYPLRRSFREAAPGVKSPEELLRQFGDDTAAAGLLIPPNYRRKLAEKGTATEANKPLSTSKS